MDFAELIPQELSLFDKQLTSAADPALVNNFSLSMFPMQVVPRELRVSREEMMSISSVWGCIRAIVDPLSAATVNVMSRDLKGNRVRHEDDTVDYLLNWRPNADLTAIAFREGLITQAVCWDDGFAEVVTDNASRVTALNLLFSDRMTLQLASEPLTIDGTTIPAGGLVYRYSQPGCQDAAGDVFLPPSRVLHMRGPLISGLRGDCALMRATRAIAQAHAEATFAGAYFASGSVVGGIVTMPGTLSKEAKERLQADWRLKNGGRNAHSIRVLEGGAEFTPFETDAQKSQLLESRQFSVEEVARFFGIPLTVLQVHTSSQGYGRNVTDLFTGWIRLSLTSWALRFSQEATEKLFGDRSPKMVELDLRPLQRGDELQRAEAAEHWIAAGIKTRNEIRAEEGYNSAGPDLDIFTASGALVVVKKDELLRPVGLPTPVPEGSPAPAPAPASEPGEPQESPKPAKGQKVRSLAVQALERHARRHQARKTDLEKAGKPEAEAAENLASLRPRAVQELADLTALADLALDSHALDIAAASVEEGVSPTKATDHLLGAV